MSLPYLAYYIISQPLCLDYLKDSPYLDDLNDIVSCFDKSTKHRFRNAEEPEYIKFGSTRDNDKSCNIRLGQLKLMGWDLSIWLDLNVLNFTVFRTDIAQFFQPSIDCIVKAVLEQQKSAHKTISVSLYLSFFKYQFPIHLPYFQHVVLVGGFAASDWLFSKVHELLIPVGLDIVRPENHLWVFSKIKTTLLFKNLFQKQSCFGWCDLILSWPLCGNSRF